MFPPVDFEAWRARVLAELQGQDFDTTLLADTPEGIRVQPVYARGATTLPEQLRAQHAATRVCPRIHGVDPTGIAPQIEDDLEGGAGALWLDRLGFVDLAELDAALGPLDPASVEILLRPGAPATTAFWIAWLLRRRAYPADVRIGFGVDPLGRLARAGTYDLDRSRKDAVALARRIHEQYPRSRALSVSTFPHHMAGGHAVHEIAAAVATGRAYLDWLVEGGLDIDDAADQIVFRFAVAQDPFLEIAKIRAFRLVWSRALAAAGLPEPHAPRIHTVDSERMLTIRDPWVNMLRSTLSAFAALVAGVDWHTSLPFDHRIGSQHALARRIARNTALILIEESGLSRVIDPTGGSGFVESYTRELATRAETACAQLDAQGGMESALLSGRWARDLSRAWTAREADLRRRRRPVTGVSEYANLAETLPAHDPYDRLRQLRAYDVRRRQRQESRRIRPVLPPAPDAALEESIVLAGEDALADELDSAWPSARAVDSTPFPVHHDADPFEELRQLAEEAAQSGHAPRVFLANIGSAQRHAARTGFARGAFAAGGIVVVSSPPGSGRDSGSDGAPGSGRDSGSGGDPSAELAAQFANANAPFACLCGHDDDYRAHAGAVSRALRAAGARRILVAGRIQESWDADLDDSIHLGSDLVATLARLLDGGQQGGL